MVNYLPQQSGIIIIAIDQIEHVEINPKKEQKKYDAINEFNAKQVVHAEPRVSKAVRPTPLPYGPLPKPPEPICHRQTVM